MNENKIPRTWESLFEKQLFLPVIVKTIEKIHDTNWSMNVNYHDHFEMVYIKRGDAVFPGRRHRRTHGAKRYYHHQAQPAA